MPNELLTSNDWGPVEHSIFVGKPDDGLSIQFAKAGDPYRHQLVWQGGNESVILLRSVDLKNDNDQSCPPIQQLVTENHGGQDVILAIGQSGKNHWSSAITVNPDRSAIEIEVACRINSNAPWLGSAYEFNADCQITEAADRRIMITTSGRQVSINSADETRLVLDRGRQLILVVAEGDKRQLPATIVWKYSIV